MITDSMDVSLGKLRELVMDKEASYSVTHGVAKSRIWLSDWTELNHLNVTKLVIYLPILKMCHYALLYWELNKKN